MLRSYVYMFFFFCKQKTAYEMRISDWSSDVCSSDLSAQAFGRAGLTPADVDFAEIYDSFTITVTIELESMGFFDKGEAGPAAAAGMLAVGGRLPCNRSEEHTSELQSLMRISYAVFCLKNKY